jgi:hypothetical protein
MDLKRKAKEMGKQLKKARKSEAKAAQRKGHKENAHAVGDGEENKPVEDEEETMFNQQ